MGYGYEDPDYEPGPVYPDDDTYCPDCGGVITLVNSKFKGSYEMCNHCGWTSFVQARREREEREASAKANAAEPYEVREYRPDPDGL